MQRIQRHLRNIFLAGIFAAIPLAATAFVILYVEKTTRDLVRIDIPFVGVAIAIATIYLLGLFVTSLIGRLFIRWLDRRLSRAPGLRDLYTAWKHISVTPGGKEGIFARVVLVPDAGGHARTLGFTSGDPLADNLDTCCVFVPAAPNPINGRLLFVKLTDCLPLPITPEEAFKIILSSGNYIPPELPTALAAACQTPVPADRQSPLQPKV